MEKILERYERYSYADQRQFIAHDPQAQVHIYLYLLMMKH